MKLLLCEDEPAMAEAVADILRYHGFLVDTVADGKDGLAYARLGGYDGLILDIMLPGLDGLGLLRALREEGCRLPVLLLTAKAELEDRVRGLDAGADDYLPKPFAMEELLARTRAMLRRRESYTPDELRYAGLALDRRGGQLCAGGRSVSLSRLEMRLMEQLMLARGGCLSSQTLLEQVWGLDSRAELGAVWVYISALRRHLRELGAPARIRARRGLGYTLEELP